MYQLTRSPTAQLRCSRRHALVISEQCHTLDNPHVCFTGGACQARGTLCHRERVSLLARQFKTYMVLRIMQLQHRRCGLACELGRLPRATTPRGSGSHNIPTTSQTVDSQVPHTWNLLHRRRMPGRERCLPSRASASGWDVYLSPTWCS